MPRIFISYRRDDSGYIAGMLAERLEAVFGADSVFIDVDAIPLGVDFREYLNQAVAKSELMLALMGNEWLNVKNAQGLRRLDDPADFVRIEIEAALKRQIPVVPVLLEQARMPLEAELPPSLQPLAFRNAAEIRSGRDLNYHIEQLIRGIKNQYGGTASVVAADTQVPEAQPVKVSEQTTKKATEQPAEMTDLNKTPAHKQRKPVLWLLAAVGALAVLGLALNLWLKTVSDPPYSTPSSNNLPMNNLDASKDLNSLSVQQIPNVQQSKLPPVEQLPLPSSFDINSITPSKGSSLPAVTPNLYSYFQPCLAGTRNVIVGSGYDNRAEALARLQKFRAAYPNYKFKLLNTVASGTSYSNEQAAIIVGHGLNLDSALQLQAQVRNAGVAADAYISNQTVSSDCIDLSGVEK